MISDRGEWDSSISRAQKAILSLSDVLGRPLPESPTYSENPALRLLNDAELCDEISARLRLLGSGAGDDTVCRWLYDTFHSMDPTLQLAVLRFVPTIAGVYLPRAAARRPLPGYEAVLLALYAHETTARGEQPVTVTVPDVFRPSVYHEGDGAATAGELAVGVISPALEPHGAVRATKRARIVGVALEMYCAKVCLMPARSKVDFCEFCLAWAGPTSARDEAAKEGGRIPLPWELLQPSLRILGHCLMGTSDAGEVQDKAAAAVRGLLARATLDVDARAILATRSLLRAWEMAARSTKAWPDLDFLLEDPPREGDAMRELLPSPPSLA